MSASTAINEAAGRTLADLVWPETRAVRATRFVALALLGSLLLTLAAKISVPFWPVPLTLQTFAVLALSAAYGMRLALATVALYLVEGLVGLPVFAGAAAGPAYLMGTTGGFLIGFLVIALLVGLAADRGWGRRPFRLGAAMLVADGLVFALGFLWLAFFARLASGGTGIGAAAAWANGLAPYLLGDAVKIALAAALVPALAALVDRFRRA